MNNWHITENELPQDGIPLIFILASGEVHMGNCEKGVFCSMDVRSENFHYWMRDHVKYWISPAELELPTEDKMDVYTPQDRTNILKIDKDAASNSFIGYSQGFCEHSGVELKKEPKLIPFNLERALAGDPVVTRDGRKILEFAYLKTRKKFNLLALVEIVDNSELKAFDDDGKFCLHPKEPEYDLFMLPKTKKYYVHIYRDSKYGNLSSCIYKDEPDNKILPEHGPLKVFEFEVEE